MKKKSVILVIAIMFIAVSVVAYAQMFGWKRYWVDVVNVEGQPINDILVDVYKSGTDTKAVLATDRTASETMISPQPVNSRGTYSFWCQENLVDVTITETPISKSVLKSKGVTPQRHRIVFYPSKLAKDNTTQKGKVLGGEITFGSKFANVPNVFIKVETDVATDNVKDVKILTVSETGATYKVIKRDATEFTDVTATDTVIWLAVD